jgi:thioredoxin-related protein
MPLEMIIMIFDYLDIGRKYMLSKLLGCINLFFQKENVLWTYKDNDLILKGIRGTTKQQLLIFKSVTCIFCQLTKTLLML